MALSNVKSIIWKQVVCILSRRNLVYGSACIADEEFSNIPIGPSLQTRPEKTKPLNGETVVLRAISTL